MGHLDTAAAERTVTAATTAALHLRVASALDWPLRDVESFSLPTLAAIVREKDMKLSDDIRRHVAAASHLTSASAVASRRSRS